MTFKELKETSRPHYYCFSLDKFFPKTIRNILRKGSALTAIVSFALSFDSLPLSFGKADGLFFLFVFIYLTLSFLEFFYKSMMNDGLFTRIKEKSITGNLDFGLSSILFATDDIDVTSALFETKIGAEIFLRLSISLEDCKKFIYSERSFVMSSSLNLEGDFINLFSYFNALYDADKSLQAFLSQNSINKEEFVGAVSWVMKIREQKQRRDRFWSKENLGKIPSIGKSWAFGIARDLSIFGSLFKTTVPIPMLDIGNGYREKEVTTLEGVLEKGEGANAIIIDDDEMVARDIMSRLLKKIKLGVSFPSIEHKSIIELDTNFLLSSYKSKTELEVEILKIFNQSVIAGNIILYISRHIGRPGEIPG